MAKAGASIRDLDVSEQKLIDCDRLESGGKAIDICSNGVKGLHWHLKYYRRQKEEVFWYSNIQNCDFRFISFFQPTAEETYPYKLQNFREDYKNRGIPYNYDCSVDVVEYIDYDNLRFGVKLIETDYDANCNEEKIQRMIMKLGSVIVGVHAGEEFHAYKKTFKVLYGSGTLIPPFI